MLPVVAFSRFSLLLTPNNTFPILGRSIKLGHNLNQPPENQYERRHDVEELRADDNWWRIYEDSFPRANGPLEAILESVLRGVGVALRAHSQGSRFGDYTSSEGPCGCIPVYLAVAERKGIEASVGN